MKTKLYLVAACVTLLSTEIYASGSYGGGVSSTPRPQRQVDQTYEVGKSIYNGRQAGVPALSYCVQVDGENVPVKRRTIKAYKGASYDELAQNLYNCNDPEQKVAEELGRDNFLYVVYYLNKRHKLNLRGG